MFLLIIGDIMTRAWRKKNINGRRQVALDGLLKVKKPNDKQKAQIETLEKRLKI